MGVHDTVQEAGIKTISKKKKCKKAKWLSEEGLQIAEKKEVKSKGKIEIYTSECRVPKNSKERKKDFLSDQCKEIEENIEWERLETSSTKLDILRHPGM